MVLFFCTSRFLTYLDKYVIFWGVTEIRMWKKVLHRSGFLEKIRIFHTGRRPAGGLPEAGRSPALMKETL